MTGSAAFTGLALAALLAAAPPAHPVARAIGWSQLTIRERIILRVPAKRVTPIPAVHWREKKGPRCMTLAGVAGASVVDPQAVDFILAGGTRLRAHFERSCPALDFYSGFYLAPTADGRICAGRDELRDRTGNACGIDRFRLLTPDTTPPAASAKPHISG